MLSNRYCCPLDPPFHRVVPVGVWFVSGSDDLDQRRHPLPRRSGSVGQGVQLSRPVLYDRDVVAAAVRQGDEPLGLVQRRLDPVWDLHAASVSLPLVPWG